jgi:hypothetical protein
VVLYNFVMFLFGIRDCGRTTQYWVVMVVGEATASSLVDVQCLEVHLRFDTT